MSKSKSEMRRHAVMKESEGVRVWSLQGLTEMVESPIAYDEPTLEYYERIDGPHIGETVVKVIEKSAYDALRAERDEMAEVAKRRYGQAVELQIECDALRAENERLKAERDERDSQLAQLYAICKSAQGTRDLVIKERDDLRTELIMQDDANEILTRYLDEAKAERDALRAENERLKAERDEVAEVAKRRYEKIIELQLDCDTLEEDLECKAAYINSLQFSCGHYEKERDALKERVRALREALGKVHKIRAISFSGPLPAKGFTQFDVMMGCFKEITEVTDEMIKALAGGEKEGEK